MLDGGGLQPDWVDDLTHDVARQMPPCPLNLKLNLSKGIVSSTPSTPSPVLSRGKDMKAFLAAQQKENRRRHENRQEKLRGRQKPEVESSK